MVSGRHAHIKPPEQPLAERVANTWKSHKRDRRYTLTDVTGQGCLWRSLH